MCNGSIRSIEPNEPIESPVGAPASGARVIDNKGKRALPVGIESFESVVARHVYVDKTLLARDLLDRGGTTLFCRPRRFGKSLALRMLQCFFEKPVEGFIPDRRPLFENLTIWDAGAEYRAEQGQYPVIYLSLGGANGATWDEARDHIANAVAAEFRRHRYLLDGTVMEVERPLFERLTVGQASPAELARSLAWLSTLLREHHGAETVILIDEYDRPITDGHLGGFRDEATRFMRSWLTDALKSTVDLRLSAITGVQRVSRESIFSDLNNLTVDTPLDRDFAESFGFTEPEVAALAAYTGHAEKLDELRAWYDGYCFGGTRMYNPISTLRYLRQGIAQPYWTNTSGNAVVTRLFQRADFSTNANLQKLAQGGTIEAPLNMQVISGEIDSDTSAVWSQLYLGGYVTTDDVGHPEDAALTRRLRLPNREVRALFDREFLERANRLASGGRLAGLHEALLAGDAHRFGELLSCIVEESASFRDLAFEGPCHMLLMGMLYEVPGYRYPTSNRESGLGYSDILLEPQPEHAARLPVIALEVKRARTAAGGDVENPEELARHARDVALAQAVEKRYGAGLPGAGRVLWGVSFSGKRVAVACKAVPASAPASDASTPNPASDARENRR